MVLLCFQQEKQAEHTSFHRFGEDFRVTLVTDVNRYLSHIYAFVQCLSPIFVCKGFIVLMQDRGWLTVSS